MAEVVVKVTLEAAHEEQIHSSAVGEKWMRWLSVVMDEVVECGDK